MVGIFEILYFLARVFLYGLVCGGIGVLLMVISPATLSDDPDVLFWIGLFSILTAFALTFADLRNTVHRLREGE